MASLQEQTQKSFPLAVNLVLRPLSATEAETTAAHCKMPAREMIEKSMGLERKVDSEQERP